MWIYSIVTYLHFISIFILFSALVFEFSILQQKMAIGNIKKLKIADLFFGVFAGLTIITGLLRMFYFGKGTEYYVSNPIFILKISLFIIIGLLSIYPTIQFLKLGKNQAPIEEIKQIKIISFLIRLELVLLLVIPFLAVLMAKGIGV